MKTISLISGNYMCGKGLEDCTNELIHPCFGNKYLTNYFLGSSSKRTMFVWPKYLRSSRNTKEQRFHVAAKIRKKHDYPWPDNIDPNITSGYLSYLSHFKPLAEKPKVVTLDFEKPLVDLEKKIIEIRRMADDTGLDFSNQIGSLESKYQQALKDLYSHLTPIQRLMIARHPNRPTVLDHILNITDKWIELHGDRAGYDDPAIVTGIGSMDGKSYMFIGHQKGRNTKENIARNFAMPTPHGYRKALRMMKYADHHKFPIITFVDTPGAYADMKSEELGQGEAIAHNLRTMFGLKVPIVTVVTGEGGSGGALAIACPNKMFMLENSAFYVASPEACAAILWKSSKAAPKAAEKLRITAQEHYRLGIADGIIPEPVGGAHADPTWTSQQIKLAITQAMEELTKMDEEELLHHRHLKFRSIGGFQEGKPVEPERKRRMKPSEVNSSNITDVESELQGLKKIILEAKGPSDPISKEPIQKLVNEVDQEITKALISMGLTEKVQSVMKELSSKASNDSPNQQPLDGNLKEKVDKIMQEIKSKMSQPGAYLGLKQKLQKLDTVNRLMEVKSQQEKLRQELNQKLSDDTKAKIATLMQAQEQGRTQEMISNGESTDKELEEKAVEVYKELEGVFQSANLEVVGVRNRSVDGPLPPEIEQKIADLNNEIISEIDRVVNAEGLKGQIKKLESEIAQGSKDVEKMEAGIKERILAALDVTALNEKIERLREEVKSSSKGVSGNKIGMENGRW
ncbi:acetyl-coenzyme A carboxylase carboxyl transferase subunit alpha, chloroplastic-like [Lotus japonicus]|uniref:acetyl-coenzyme A carboxylase carboxyl transferase subunit alpha, chloroplastic-like n=1 Tax=Lotus japonicus TaxID=34305 RepID=UPI00258AE426|nr:acetyl-coenzyme A carboxylase carboxyl transferase subunit alpha, chloroplastic-like [Lotus japonicus]XP_057435611.1 acetyl-coenzyme A carboxylase carboxyl transferase subunit alpha, chloroplastic-like [Lotus japonicus]XP_057435612.1 acetyl-coenzyme A carboxylase carboxyl transferase subunit alpha, chloroplastic-like [Lotus japonicus]